MRALYTILLLIFLAALGIFAFQNQQAVTLNFLDRSVTCPMALLVGAGYLLGMLSGWTVVGLVTRSLRHVTQRRRSYG